MENFRTTNQRDSQLKTIFVAKQREAEGVPTPEDQTSKKKHPERKLNKNATDKRFFQTADEMTLKHGSPQVQVAVE